MTEKNKIPGVLYVQMENGPELPVLDITHPLFISSIKEDQLDVLGKQAVTKAKQLKNMPVFLKNFMSKHSLIMAGFFRKNPGDNYLNALGTLMFKLGPGLIGSGMKKYYDRMAAASYNGISIRMRLRDMSRHQADSLATQLQQSPRKNLSFINIAGGTACDSINALILLHQQNPSLLQERKIEILILDVDQYGPHYAEQCLTALTKPGQYFHGLDITSRHMHYNWHDTAPLSSILAERRDWIIMAASEGGLCEYAVEAVILQNLAALAQFPGDVRFVGSAVHDLQRVNPSIPVMAEMSGLSTQFLGSEGLRRIVDKSAWKLEKIQENNPNMIVFTLKKNTL